MFKGIESSVVFAWFLGIGALITFILVFVNWNLRNETFEVNCQSAKSYRIGKFKVRPKAIWKYTKIVVLHLLTMFSIFTVGGISDAAWLNGFTPNHMAVEEMGGFLSWFLLVIALIIFIGLPIFLTYLVGFLVIGLPRYTKKYSQIIFVLTFLVSIVFWTSYMVKYDANIEVTTETVQQTQERELVMFYEIPLQQISGSVSGGSFIGSGSVSGSIFTADSVPYVYITENGNGKWDSAPAADSEIVFLTESGDTPKIAIVTYTERTVEIDHNVEKKNVTDEKSWTKYYFYIPKSVVQTFETE